MKHFKAQCGEDRWIETNWKMLGLPKVGFFVEFGAGDGVHYSNTYWLEKIHGWNGVLIEADPRNQITDRSAVVERCAVGAAGTVSFGLHPTDTFLSGAMRETPERIEVPSLPLTAIFQKHNISRVDLISVDTEGNEVECWKTLDLSICRPTVAIIELFTWKLPDRSKEVFQMMEADGYELVHRTELNGIFKSR